MTTLFRGIGWRLFFSFSMLLIGLTLIYSFVALKFVQKTATDNAANELRVFSVTLSEQLQRYLKRVESGAKSLSGSGGVLDLELLREAPRPRRLEHFLQQKLTQLPIFESLSVFSTDGICVASTDADWSGVTAQRELFFITGLKRFSFMEIYENRDQQKVLLISTPINESNDPHGVLVGKVKLSFLYDLISEQLGLNGSSEAFLLDSRLRFMTPTRNGPDELMQSHLAQTPLVQHLQDEFWVGRYFNAKNREVLGTVMHLPGNRWYLVVERDFAEVEDRLSQVKQALCFSTMGILVLLIFVTVLLTTSITRPLQALVEGTRRIAAGDLSQAIEVPPTSDEISFLAAEFDRMRARVAASQGRLIEQLEESEQRRIENERLAAIGTLASSLAHEIRNPLNAVSLLLSQLERTKEGIEKKQKMIDEMRSEIGRLDRLVSDILDYSRPVQLQKEPIDLAEFVSATAAFYQGIFTEKSIKLDLEIPSTPVEIEGDRDKLRQTLVNLIQNAVDAMAQGGHLSIKVLNKGSFAECLIKDSGVGIEPGSRSRLFDLFFTTKERGTGLGLSVVKKIVDAHGGRITIASVPKQGTTISLEFPKSS